MFSLLSFEKECTFTCNMLFGEISLQHRYYMLQFLLKLIREYRKEILILLKKK